MHLNSNFKDDFPELTSYVVSHLQNRAAIGLAKYGISMERQDLTPVQWCVHLEQEIMDSIVYSEKLKMIAPDIEHFKTMQSIFIEHLFLLLKIKNEYISREHRDS